MCRVCERLMDNEVPKQLNLSSMGQLMKVAPVGNICYLVFPAHLCPVEPRVLDSCSLNIRAIHIREAYGTPLSQSLIHSYFLGPQLVWCFITILYLCHVYCFITIVRGAPVLFRIVTRFCCIGKPSHTFGFPVVYSRPHKP